MAFCTFALMLICVLSAISSIVMPENIEADPIVNVQQGSVRGTNSISAGGRQYFQFRGIPFAKPPVGELRFQPPKAADNWEGIYNATDNNSVCIQWGGSVHGSEDCLYLYVYTPFLPNGDVNVSLPVMVWIHGGGFSQGAPAYDIFHPEGFMDKDIVLASIGYRLGPLGFFSTGDDSSLGNYGMLDQVAALKWIQDNVAAFGGDPSRVTIFGGSAGGASVVYHVLANASAGLFRGAITASGSTMCPWALQKNPLSWAIRFAQQLNCSYDNTSILTDCVRHKPAEDLIQATVNINNNSAMVIPFAPVVENKITGRFLTEYPIQILEEGTINNVAVISGINKDEGHLTYTYTQEYYSTIDDNFYNNILPVILTRLTNYENNLINVSYAVKAEYFDKIDVSNQTQVAQTAIDLNSDPSFKAPNDYTVRKLAARGLPVYMYSFEFPGNSSYEHFLGAAEISHGEELFYMFFENRDKFTDQDLLISDALINMWTSFADQLNPTPSGNLTWVPTTNTTDLKYLRIQNELSMQEGYLTERMNFWNEDVPKIVVS